MDLRSPLKIVSGTSNIELSNDICNFLNVPLSKTMVTTYSDGETRVEVEDNVRGADVFVIQSTSAPVNHNVMELCIILDALKRCSCKRVTAVIPYYGYGRQDRKVRPRVPISARLVSDLISVAGVNRILTLDLHAGQIQGFFNCPVDNLYAYPTLLKKVKDTYDSKNIVVVSPDAGGTDRARSYAKRLNCDLAIVDKRRPSPNQIAEMRLIGDVSGKVAIILDDMIDTAGTICCAADVLIKNGATEVIAFATHGVLSGEALNRIYNSSFSAVYVTNTIPVDNKISMCEKLNMVNISELLGKAIKNIHEETSVSCLFDE